MIWKTETERLYDHPFLPPLRFYVYVMPKEFTYDLLTLFRNTYRETSNLTSNGNPVHRLIEQPGRYQFVDLPPKRKRMWRNSTWVSSYQSSCSTCAVQCHLLLPTR